MSPRGTQTPALSLAYSSEDPQGSCGPLHPGGRGDTGTQDLGARTAPQKAAEGNRLQITEWSGRGPEALAGPCWRAGSSRPHRQQGKASPLAEQKSSGPPWRKSPKGAPGGLRAGTKCGDRAVLSVCALVLEEGNAGGYALLGPRGLLSPWHTGRSVHSSFRSLTLLGRPPVPLTETHSGPSDGPLPAPAHTLAFLLFQTH